MCVCVFPFRIIHSTEMGGGVLGAKLLALLFFLPTLGGLHDNFQEDEHGGEQEDENEIFLIAISKVCVCVT